MAQIPGTPKLESRDFGRSYLLALTSDRDEVCSKVVALVEIFPMPCNKPESDIANWSIPDF
jgi:hypothetical protein